MSHATLRGTDANLAYFHGSQSSDADNTTRLYQSSNSTYVEYPYCYIKFYQTKVEHDHQVYYNRNMAYDRDSNVFGNAQMLMSSKSKLCTRYQGSCDTVPLKDLKVFA